MAYHFPYEQYRQPTKRKNEDNLRKNKICASARASRIERYTATLFSAPTGGGRNDLLRFSREPGIQIKKQRKNMVLRNFEKSEHLLVYNLEMYTCILHVNKYRAKKTVFNFFNGVHGENCDC